MSAGGAAGHDAWRRGLVGWHGAFGALVVLSGALAVGEDAPARRYAAIALLGALSLWYGAVGARAVRVGPGRLGLVYLVVAAPLTVVLYALVPACALMLCALYPHIWALLPVDRAVVGTVLVLAGVAAVIIGQSGPGGDGLLVALVYTGAGLVVALLLGLWITRIIEQSRRRAELLAELAATREELAAVSREAGALAERARVARDIHDTLAQGFASVLLQLAAVSAELGGDEEAVRRHLAAAEGCARANLAEARSLVGALSPPDLRARSLVEALGRLISRTGDELTVATAFEVTGRPRALPASTEVVLFRAAQEALTNAGKHAAAGTVSIGLSFDDDQVTLTVTDDGRGFPSGNGSGGLGLAGMRARAAEAGGAVSVDSVPGKGVTVRLDLPVERP